jgi:hypothetical protein
MDSIVDPSADEVWGAVAVTVDATGTHVKQPRSDAEWAEVRRSAIRLVEAPNLLVVPGRHVARQGEKADDPQVELGPEEIEKRINQDRPAFIKLAQGLQDAASKALKAIDDKNVQALTDVGGDIDTACENCHVTYWYPQQKQVIEQEEKRYQQ